MGDSDLIVWQVTEFVPGTNPPETNTTSGNGNSFSYSFAATGNNNVLFFLDRNSNGIADSGEPIKQSETFQVVNPATHALTFEFSSLLTGNVAIGVGTPAQRLAWAQRLADTEDDVLHIKQNPDDWRAPVVFTMAPSAAGGTFVVSPNRPDQGTEYDALLHTSRPHDVTFTFSNPFVKTEYLQGAITTFDPADGVTDFTGSVLAYDAPSRTFIHEIGHLYGSHHTAVKGGYLMHPAAEGGILRHHDATNFFNGNKI